MLLEWVLMDSESTHWSSVLASIAWLAFFVLLFFKPLLARDYPILAVVCIAGLIWWGAQARRTRRSEKKGLLEHTDSN